MLWSTGKILSSPKITRILGTTSKSSTQFFIYFPIVCTAKSKLISKTSNQRSKLFIIIPIYRFLKRYTKKYWETTSEISTQELETVNLHLKPTKKRYIFTLVGSSIVWVWMKYSNTRKMEWSSILETTTMSPKESLSMN